MSDQKPDPTTRQFPCKQCGGLLTFEPGTDSLKCPYCGTENEIAASTEAVEELDFTAAMNQLLSTADTIVVADVKCTTCGAASTLPAGTTSGRCPFCGQPIVAEGVSKRLIKPKSLLPFRVNKPQAIDSYKRWLGSLWFAPGDLSKFADRGKIDGVYIPAWTYDADTFSNYTGERGDDYWDTETYTETVNGQSVTRTRQVRRTRWHSVSGRVRDVFDDVLILATDSLPPKCRDHLQPWDLPALVPYQDDYLSGFVTETYQVDLPTGFDRAKGVMAVTIRRTIENDIGGDHQRIDRVNTAYRDITFKHILLPLWISAYTIRGRTYRFLVNARTGKVAGERPYSVWKIALAVLLVIVIVAIGVWLAQRGHSTTQYSAPTPRRYR